MLRKYLLGRYVDLTDVEDILGHSPFVYLRGVLVYSVLLFLVYVGFSIWHQYSTEIYVQRIAGIIGLFLFCRWLLGFLNLYLDCILVSKDSLTVFLRDGILEYRTEIIDWSKILVISHRQDSLRDRICGKGDIMIQMGNDIDFPFSDIAHPKKSASKLMLNKKNHDEKMKKKIEEDLEGDQRQFDILVDALGEVIRDYMDSKNNEERFND